MQRKRFTKSNPAVKPSHKGRLHTVTGTPQGQTIPLSKLNAALHATKPKAGYSPEHIRKMAKYAETMKHWK